MSESKSRLVVGPFNRVEGDLQVHLDIEQDRVRSARVNAQMYRGFEQILTGKLPQDALVIVPRICGICSVSQSVAAAMALGEAMGVTVAPHGARLANLVHAVENVADHFTHFYLFFMPDFAHPEYAGRDWYADIQQRFTAIQGTAMAPMLQARAGFMQLMGLFAGKWPHTLSIQPGGVTHGPERADLLRAGSLLSGFRAFVERELFGDSLDTLIAVGSEAELEHWARNNNGDLARFVHLAGDLNLQDYGKGPGALLSYGAYGFGEAPLFARGVWQQGLLPLDITAITEDVMASRLQGSPGPVPVQDGQTLPAADKPEAYSWCKAPRLDGAVMETGALARQVIDGHPLARELFGRHGACVYTRILARMLELARVTVAMQDWLAALEPAQQVYQPGDMPEQGQGVGLTEAARGSLGHWLQIRNGRIHNYQIIAPTTWNFSPRDSEGRPGALEQALQGTPVVAGDHKPVLVQHIVRSFDPCMVCTVH